MSVNMTFALPDDLHELMRHYPQVKWADVARRAFQQELDRLQILDRLLADSTMTEDDAVRLGRSIRRGVTRRAAAARTAADSAPSKPPARRGGAGA